MGRHFNFNQTAIIPSASALSLICVLTVAATVNAAGAGGTDAKAATVTTKDTQGSGLASLIDLGLQNSFETKASRLETRAQDSNETLTDATQNIPQVSLSASFQSYKFDSLHDTGGGTFVKNDGNKPAFGLQVTYDLQKLLSGDSKLAKEAARLSKVQEKLTERTLIRDIKKNFYAISEMKSEMAEIKEMIQQFKKIESVLNKQKMMGLRNDIERKQFQIQKSLLETDLETRSLDLENAYTQLATLMNVSVDLLKNKISAIDEKPVLHFASQDLSVDQLANKKDQQVVESLGANYNLAKLEYESFRSSALPQIYVKGSREMPTMPSSDGFQNIAEVGVSIPIETFFLRPTQKSQLKLKSDKADVLFQKSMADYRNQIRVAALNLNRQKAQTEKLSMAQQETKSLLDQAFLYYSQKRIDSIGALDIFQKHLQATRNLLLNRLQIASFDADLEYLVGTGE